MACARRWPCARRLLCPDLLVVRPRFDVYRAVSKQIHAIFRDYTDLIEPLSLDEAYLDVSASPHFAGSATRIAQDIRRRVAEELHITVSAGVAPNKFLAKIASDWRKPDGLFVITRSRSTGSSPSCRWPSCMASARSRRSAWRGWASSTCADLRQGSKLSLVREFGSFGERLWGLAHGIDERPVEVDSRRQSVSVECTFDRDLPDLAACLEELPTLLGELDGRLQRLDGSYRPDKPFVKLKFHDFTADHGGTVRRRARPGELPAIARPGLCPWQSSGAPDRRRRAPARPAGRPRTTPGCSDAPHGLNEVARFRGDGSSPTGKALKRPRSCSSSRRAARVGPRMAPVVPRRAGGRRHRSPDRGDGPRHAVGSSTLKPSPR